MGLIGTVAQNTADSRLRSYAEWLDELVVRGRASLGLPMRLVQVRKIRYYLSHPD